MKVTTRLALFILIVTVAFMAGLTVIRWMETKEVNALFADREREENLNFDKLLELKGLSLKTMSLDYTFWDEMVTFVSRPNKKWAAQNIEVSLGTFKVNAAWVLRLDHSLVYSVNNLEEKSLKKIPWPGEAYKTIFTKDYFPHFFVNTSRGLLEIRGAPIQSSADAARKTPPQGYFFVAKLWDQEYIKELNYLIGGELKLVPYVENRKTMERSDLGAGKIAFSRLLSGWDGKPLIRIENQRYVPIYREFSNRSDIQFQILLIFAGSLLLLTYTVLVRWVSHPLLLISRSLDANDPAFIKDLQKEKSEFGELGRLVNKFFDQLRELQIFHDATVGRELKMMELEKEVNSLLLELKREAKYK